MSLFLVECLSNLDQLKELDFYNCSVIMSNGTEVFSKVAQLDKENYIFNYPVKVLREYNKSTTYGVTFDMFSPFSDDSFFVIKSSSIMSISYISEKYLPMYNSAIDQIIGVVSKRSSDLHSNESELYFDDIDDEEPVSIDESDETDKPTLLH